MIYTIWVVLGRRIDSMNKHQMMMMLDDDVNACIKQ